MKISSRFLAHRAAFVAALLIFASPAYLAGQCTILTNATQGISYTFVQSGGTNATSVAYNPLQNIYYAVIGGNSGFPLETFTPGGVSLYQTNSGFDSRGLWWNYSAGQLQANGFSTFGTWAFDLDANGYALNTGASLFTGQNQPDVQSCGSYDCADNQIIYYNNGDIYRYSATTGAFIASFPLTGVPVPLSSINTSTALYTGCTGNEIAVEDFVDKAILLFNISTGAYSGQSLLPASAPADGYLHLGYANNLVWLFDVNARVWTSYSIFSGNPTGGIAVNLGNDTNLCTGQTLVLDAGNAGASYLWQDGSTNQTFTVNQPGTYSVVVSKACYTGTDTIVVGSSGALLVNLGADTTLCNGGDLLLNAATPGGTYVWQDNSTGSIYNVTSAGTYSVTITAGGCSGADSITVGFGGPVIITSGLQVSPASCGLSNGAISGLAITGGTLPYTQAWDTGNVLYSTSLSLNGLPGAIYTLTVSDSNGCNADTSITVTQTAAAVPPVISAGKDSVCPGDSVSICASPQNYSSYAWSDGSTTACITTSFTGDYSVTVSENNCTATSNMVHISNFSPTPVSVSVNGDTLTGYHATGYQWYLNDSAIAGATASVYIARVPGTYTLHIIDANGCSYNSTPVSVTGLEQLAESNIMVFPNPTSSGWQLMLNEALLGSALEVFDAAGKIIFRSVISSTLTTINVPGLANGVYELRINTGQLNVLGKLVKI